MMMTPAERFVVVAGASLLVLNVLLFSFCLALVLDSQATRNENAELLALTQRLLESHEPHSAATSPTQATPIKACPLAERFTGEVEVTTETSTEEPDSESGAVTEIPYEGEEDLERSSFERQLKVIQDQLDTLKRSFSKLANASESSSVSLRRRRRRREVS